MSTATSATANDVDGDLSTNEIGPFRACWWAIEELVSAPLLLPVAALLGAFRTVAVEAGPASGTSYALLPFELYLMAVLYGYVGLTYGEFYDLRDVLLQSGLGAVRLGLLSIVFGGALFVSMLFLVPLGYLGFFIFVLVAALLFINVLLLGPAVCIDEGVIPALGKAWALADEARWTVLGLLVLTWIPFALVHAAIGDVELSVLAAIGLALGPVDGVFHLALGRIYIGQRA